MNIVKKINALNWIVQLLNLIKIGCKIVLFQRTCINFVQMYVWVNHSNYIEEYILK